MMVDITQLRSLQQAADILRFDRNYLSFYAGKKRFTKPYIVAGVKYYHVDDIMQWKPEAKKYEYKDPKNKAKGV